mmetsp:Transcript_12978/g.19553  ORF Transcript_12978/g.19553 Transcript_12978/m.19553 type:complete len:2663 (-) Transcript_12978:33-8021(-)
MKTLIYITIILILLIQLTTLKAVTISNLITWGYGQLQLKFLPQNSHNKDYNGMGHDNVFHPLNMSTNATDFFISFETVVGYNNNTFEMYGKGRSGYCTRGRTCSSNYNEPEYNSIHSSDSWLENIPKFQFQGKVNNMGFLTADGRIFSLGRNSYHQLGIGETTSSQSRFREPHKIDDEGYSTGYDGFVATILSIGYLHTCVYGYYSIDSRKAMLCMGRNVYGQAGQVYYGNQSTNVPYATEINYGGIIEEDRDKIVDIKTGNQQTYIVLSNGKIYSMGYNYYGNGNYSDDFSKTFRTDAQFLPQIFNIEESDYEPGNGVHDIGVGANFGMLLTNSRTLQGWGRNWGSRLPTLDYQQFTVKTMAYTMGHLPDLIEKLSVGSKVFVTLQNGQIFTWSSNRYGGMKPPAHPWGQRTYGLPYELDYASFGIPGIPNIVTNYQDAFVLLHWDSGEAFISKKIFSDDGTHDRKFFYPERYDYHSIIKNTVTVEGGVNSALLLSDGKVYGWGNGNNYNFLGYTSGSNELEEIDTTMAGTLITLSCEFAYHCLATSADNKAYGWGYAYNGQLGYGGRSHEKEIFLLDNIPGLFTTLNVSRVYVRHHFSFLIMHNGQVWSSGINSQGRTGRGQQINSGSNVFLVWGQLADIDGIIITDISCSHISCIARTDNFKVWGWGYNSHSQLGTGDTTHQYYPYHMHEPGRALHGKQVLLIHQEYYTGLAYTLDGEFYCWGRNVYYPCGNSINNGYHRTPVKVELDLPDSPLKKITGSHHKRFFLFQDGSLWALGLNHYYILGLEGSTGSRSTPTQVAFNSTMALPNVTLITSEYQYTAVISSDTYHCFGLPPESSEVCSGHGECIQSDKCVCNDTIWTGPDCGNVACYHASSFSKDVCSGHGVCVGPDDCLCDDGWRGYICEEPRCWGAWKNDTGSCNFGECVYKDTCVCTDNTTYTGFNCSYPICKEIVSTNINVCSNHGDCITPEQCACETNWAGNETNDCNFPICYGLTAFDDNVCSGTRGDCVGVNSCTCTDAGYKGDTCEISNCFSIWGDEPTVCSSHGNCTDIDTCECENGYAEAECNFNACNGLSELNSSVCSGHGSCFLPNTCDCDGNFRGEDCEVNFCNGVWGDEGACSGNGVCIDYNTCVCNSNFTGFNCSIPICYGIDAMNSSVCSTHGACEDPFNCVCEHGYTGHECQYVICQDILHINSSVCQGRGDCIEPDSCACNEPHKHGGYDCEFYFCHNVLSNESATCSSHGACIDYNNCSCESTWHGDNCQSPICYGYPATHMNVCSTFGECVYPDNCTCNEGYTGDECEYVICFGINHNIDNVCSGHGQCTLPDTCICEDGYRMGECEQNRCFNVWSNESSTCSSHGSCIAKDTCVCVSTYTGENCQYPICYDVPSNESTTCSGEGNCTYPDNCECNEGYVGDNCEHAICMGIPGYSPSTCSGHGSCVLQNSCNCSEGYLGDTCQYAYCNGTPSYDNTTCSGHGTCQLYEDCDCNDNYFGDNCELFKCHNVLKTDESVCSSSGVCIEHDTCECDGDHAGTLCQYNEVDRPVGILKANSLISECANGYLDARQSHCPLGGLTYFWKAYGNASNIQALNLYLSTIFDSELHIPSNYLLLNKEYSIRLIVAYSSDFVSHPVYKTIMRIDKFIPTSLIIGENIGSIFRDESVSFISAFNNSLTCSGQPIPQIKANWKQLDSLDRQVSFTTVGNGMMINFEPFSFPFVKNDVMKQDTYTFQVSFDFVDPNVDQNLIIPPESQNITVNIKQLPLIIKLDKVTPLIIDAQNVNKIDASLSKDLDDNTDLDAQFIWGLKTNDSQIVLENSTSLYQLDNSLIVSHVGYDTWFNLSITYVKGLRKVSQILKVKYSTDQTELDENSQDNSISHLLDINGKLYANVDQLYQMNLVYQNQASDPISSITWSSTEGHVGFILTANDVHVSNQPTVSALHREELILKNNVLKAGFTYIFKVTIVTAGGLTGSAYHQVQLNEGPKFGSLSVIPGTIHAMQTQVTASATDWNDVNLPLQYQFTLKKQGSSTVISLTDFFPSNTIEFKIPSDGQWLVSCNVRDNFGAISSSSVLVNVLASTTDPSDILDSLLFNTTSSNGDGNGNNGNNGGNGNNGNNGGDDNNGEDGSTQTFIDPNDEDLTEKEKVQTLQTIIEMIPDSDDNGDNSGNSNDNDDDSNNNPIKTVLNDLGNIVSSSNNTDPFKAGTGNIITVLKDVSIKLGNDIDQKDQNKTLTILENLICTRFFEEIKTKTTSAERYARKKTYTDTLTTLSTIIQRSLKNKDEERSFIIEQRHRSYKVMGCLTTLMSIDQYNGEDVSNSVSSKYGISLFKDISSLTIKNWYNLNIESFRVYVPTSVQSEILQHNEESISLQLMSYSHDLFIDVDETQLVSTVMDFSILNGSSHGSLPIKNLQEELILEFTLSLKEFISAENEHLYSCRFYDETNNLWSTEGCKTIIKSQSKVHCNCSHTTKFGVFKDAEPVDEPVVPEPEPEPEPPLTILGMTKEVFIAVTSSVSALALLALCLCFCCIFCCSFIICRWYRKSKSSSQANKGHKYETTSVDSFDDRRINNFYDTSLEESNENVVQLFNSYSSDRNIVVDSTRNVDGPIYNSPITPTSDLGSNHSNEILLSSNSKKKYNKNSRINFANRSRRVTPAAGLDYEYY